MLGEWTGASVEPGEGKPAPDVWTPVEVPGRPPAFAGADAVAYRTEFDDPREGDDERAVLALHGLYAHARVWLNGELVADHDTYFRPLRHAFEPAARNELVVECRAPEDRFGGVHDTDLVPGEDAVPGIWWNADVETHPATFVADLVARPRVTDEGAAIDVTAVVDAGEAVDGGLTFSLRPEGEFQSRGMMDRARVEAAAGEVATVEHTIDVHDPALWWPRGMGPQHRYAVRAKLGDATRSVTTGLSSVARHEDALLVNGERVPVRGVNLLDATAEDVDRAVDANATLVRIHAHGAPPSVYEACDEAGLLVWADLPLTGPGAFDTDRGREVARSLARTYGNHPSLAAFGVHDDPVDPFPEPLGSGTLDRLRLRWRAWRASYDRGDAVAVAAALPDDRPAFPVVGPVGTGADATTLYPGWDYGDAGDVGWLLDRFDVGAVAEFGAGALGSVDAGEAGGFARAKHDVHVDGGVDDSQRYQASVLKRVAETLRRRGSGLIAFALRDATDAGMGVLERDGTEKAGYRALRASYEPVQATLATPDRGATSDLVVVNDTADAVEGRVEYEVSEASSDAAGDRVVSGDIATEGSAEVTLDAHASATVDSVSLPADGARVRLSLSLGDRTVENSYRLY